MTTKEAVLESLWSKIHFWGVKKVAAQEALALAKSAYMKAGEELDAAENTVEYYKRTHDKLLSAVNTIEDFIND